MEPLRAIRVHPVIRSGFTLIELVVVTAIIILITAVVISGQGTFNNSVVVTSTAYDVALTLRDTQTYGLSTRASGGIANAGYGLDFTAASPHSYILFADSNPPAGSVGTCHPTPIINLVAQPDAPNAYPGNCVYDPGSDGLVSSYMLGNGVQVSNFCATDTNGATLCSTACHGVNGCSVGLSRLDVVFVRPNATPFISENGAYSASPAPTVVSACITLSSSAASRYISLSASGRILASAASCP